MNIFCIGRNYRDHAAELGNPVPSKPLLFMKPQTALRAAHGDFRMPDFTEDLHFECELVVRIDQALKNVSEEEAAEAVGALALGIDFTARDIQAQCKKKGHPWELAKAFDESAPLSDWMPLSVPISEPIQFTLELNGETRQEGDTKDLIFPIPTLISYISRFFSFRPGDMIFTGTPSGVGPVQAGDQLRGLLGDQELINLHIKD
jgi:2-keto-4-pentenoate hydratase/2-oxohepta-3-ene-1,7-dioic acid hydratase in catechol pathway